MRIYSSSTGELVRVIKNVMEAGLFGPPDSYAYELEVDFSTNPIALGYIDTAWNDVALIGATLSYQGVAIPINPPGQAWIERLREEAAETTVANIPNWATWTEAEALAWFDANVTDAATAIQVERALVRIVLAMRNKLWPNLEGS